MKLEIKAGRERQCELLLTKLNTAPSYAVEMGHLCFVIDEKRGRHLCWCKGVTRKVFENADPCNEKLWGFALVAFVSFKPRAESPLSFFELLFLSVFQEQPSITTMVWPLAIDAQLNA
jgi:hypothetical protein